MQQQYLQAQNISQNALARAIKVPPRRINEIVHEKRSVTADTAVRLGVYFSNSASYWMHLQAAFDIEKVKHNINIQLNAIPAAVALTSTEADDTPKKNKKNRNKIKRHMMR